MKEYTIGPDASGQRLDRYLNKLMPLAGKNFLQKMLRKKRIKLNLGRAEASTLIQTNDKVQIYFSDETITGFKRQVSRRTTIPATLLPIFKNAVYEDANILAVCKPAGLLTQRDSTDTPSLIDYARTWLDVFDDENTFHPAVSNRLDRNTSGVVMIPKNYDTLKAVNAAIRERKTLKCYHTIVAGVLQEDGDLKGFIEKMPDTNRVRVTLSEEDKAKPAYLSYHPLATHSGYTFLEVTLHTGRTHQIRSQLAAAGYPVIGDTKYGNPDVNAFFKKSVGLEYQLLHSYRYAISDLGYNFVAAWPPLFRDILSELGFSTPEV